MPEGNAGTGDRTLLEIISVSKSFPGVRALDSVSFDVVEGEVHAVIGENGAGKSTLMNILSGVYGDYEGEIRLRGQPLHFGGPRDAQHNGIATIHQELNLLPELTVAENVFLGREPRTPFWTLDAGRMEKMSKHALARLDTRIRPKQRVKSLRVGEQQLVEIAKALSLEASILIFDEPTSSLSDAEIERLFEVISALQREGVTILYISHKLDEIFHIADRVTVLRDGEYIGTRLISGTSRRELIHMMVGRELKDLFPKQPSETGDEVLRVEGLGLVPDADGSGRRLEDISFDLRRGEILGLAGLRGAGRTELLETLFGVNPPRRVRGRVVIDRTELTVRSPREAIRAGIAFVTEDRKTQSLIIRLSVGHNMTLAALKNFVRFGFLRSAPEKRAIGTMTKELRIKTPGPDTVVNDLSGGNQQKVALSKCLLTEPRVLLLDEPTRGIDVGAKAEIYGLIGDITSGGTAILMASSELAELVAICDRVLVLREGRLVARLTQAELTQHRIGEAAAGEIVEARDEQATRG